MNLEDWEKTPSGNIRVNPVMGWGIASVPLAGLLRVEYAQEIEDNDAERLGAIQLAVTASQARELGLALLQLADRIHAQPKGTKQ